MSLRLQVLKDSSVAISSAEDLKDFSLMDVICTKVRNSLTVDHSSDVMTVSHWENSCIHWPAAYLTYSLNQNCRLAVSSQKLAETHL